MDKFRGENEEKKEIVQKQYSLQICFGDLI